MESKKFRKWETALLLSVCVTLCVSLWIQSEQRGLSDKLIRLHVIASSNEDDDQALKLRVRDSVLEYLTPLLGDNSDIQSAAQTVLENMDGIQAAAMSASEGQTITVSLGNEMYPTRQYDSFALPAGEYTSLKVVVGEGEGENWWCVVFPPLCMSAVEISSSEAMNLTDNEISLITEDGEGYIIKFKLIELWGQIKTLFTEK